MGTAGTGERTMAMTSKTTAKRRHDPKLRTGERIRTHASDFTKDESGVLIGFGVFLILMILAVGGIGIDLMRFEFTRTSLQSTLDRAVLAAADLDQTLDAEFVVEDYFEKSEMSQHLRSVHVDQGLNYKEVAATADFEMPTQFIHMMGIDSLTATAAGTAAESVDGVEIAMVLDMSGSMNSNNRLPNLKVAAKDFIQTMVNSSPPGDVAISIVPYATQVNLGPDVAAQYNLTNEHDYSHCVEFDSSDFNSTSVSTTSQLKRTGPFDPWYRVEGELTLPVCPERAGSEVMAYSMNETALKNYVDSFTAGGNTSIDVGMKWGTALLDPTAQDVVTGMIAAGKVDAVFTGLPTAYNDDSLKVIVLMTDGSNTEQYYLNNNYRDGNTDVWLYQNGGTKVYSIKDGSYYYYKTPWSWSSYYGGYTDERWVRPNGSTTNSKYDARGTQPFNGSSSVRLTYPELFHQATNAWVADRLYDDIWSSSYANSYWEYNAYDYVGTSTKNNRLHNICDAAKEAGIIVFTIGFEAPYSGRAVLRDCASSDAHFFDVDGMEISDAFTSIASSISKLRLVQ